MRQAVIVSTARTPVGKAYRGAFNHRTSPTLAAFAIKGAISKAAVEPGEVEDVIMGASLQQGGQGFCLGCQSALASGLPIQTAGMGDDCPCSSGLMTVANAARNIIVDGIHIAIGGWVASISLVQDKHINRFPAGDPLAPDARPDFYMPMIDTAGIVSRRSGISHEPCDACSVASQAPTTLAQASGEFDNEIVAVNVSTAFCFLRLNGSGPAIGVAGNGPMADHFGAGGAAQPYSLILRIRTLVSALAAPVFFLAGRWFKRDPANGANASIFSWKG